MPTRPKPPQENLHAFGEKLRQLLSDRALSTDAFGLATKAADPVFGSGGMAIRNYINAKSAPRYPGTVLLFERLLEQPQGSLLELLGWPVPKSLPPVVKPVPVTAEQIAAIESRLTKIETTIGTTLADVAAAVDEMRERLAMSARDTQPQAPRSRPKTATR